MVPFSIDKNRYLLGALGAPGLAVSGADAGGHTVVFRVDHLLAAESLDAPVAQPPGFDLKAQWERSREALAADRQPCPVRLRAALALADELRRQFPGQREAIEAAVAQAQGGWLTVTLPFGGLEAARARILPWGGAAVVLAPESLRQSVVDYARQAAGRYEGE
jgi:predicted DNA-binding transcriptional regulator YafY